MTMKKEKVKCDLPTELRCKRTDSKTWRCSKQRTGNSSYCEHHRDNIRASSQKKKNKNSGLEVMVGITQQCLSNKYKIKQPEIAGVAVLPEDIYGLENLKDVLTVEAWKEYISPTDRCALRKLLPEGHQNNVVVESLLKGENFHFGNPALKWGASVCRGERFPKALLEREQELKSAQSQYFTFLQNYHDTFLYTVEELKELCESCAEDDKTFRKKLKKWVKKRLRAQKEKEQVDASQGLQIR